MDFELSSYSEERKALKRDYEEMKESLICSLKEKEIQINKLLDDNTSLNMMIEELNNTTHVQKDKINFLERNNEILEGQKDSLTKTNLEMNKIVQNLQINHNSILDKDNELNMVKNRLEVVIKDNKKNLELIEELKINLKNKEIEVNNYKSESLKLSSGMTSFDKELRLSNENREKLLEDNCKLFEQNEDLKRQLVILIDQNKFLINELDSIKDEYNIINSQLQQRENINTILTENRNKINRSLANVDELN